MMELPSIEQCRTFLATINRGREAIGLAALEKLDFDSCLPNDPCGCLSATHVFQPAGYRVYEEEVRPAFSYKHRSEACAAMGMAKDESAGWPLTSDVLAVTDVFDACEDNPELLKALRERMVEAGVV